MLLCSCTVTENLGKKNLMHTKMLPMHFCSDMTCPKTQQWDKSLISPLLVKLLIFVSYYRPPVLCMLIRCDDKAFKKLMSNFGSSRSEESCSAVVELLERVTRLHKQLELKESRAEIDMDQVETTRTSITPSWAAAESSALLCWIHLYETVLSYHLLSSQVVLRLCLWC